MSGRSSVGQQTHPEFESTNCLPALRWVLWWHERCHPDSLRHRRRRSQAAEKLLPLVYEELRKLAAAKLTKEKPGQTLQATALVHDAYVRLVDVEQVQAWDSRGHFFAAAAEAMRRILVDNAHRKKSLKRGGNRKRLDIADIDPAVPPPLDDLIALDEALDKLAESEAQTAELVKFRYFAGFTIKQTAELLGISPRKADSLWAYARVWLHDHIVGDPSAE